MQDRLFEANPQAKATWTPEDAAVLRATTIAGVLLEQWSKR